jgi:hypothetical protein
LLLDLASTDILGSECQGTHDCILHFETDEFRKMSVYKRSALFFARNLRKSCNVLPLINAQTKFKVLLDLTED